MSRIATFAWIALAACSSDSLELPEVRGLTAVPDTSEEEGVVEVELIASETFVEWVDGGSTAVWTYNGSVPGPLIQAQVGDTLRVHFTNSLSESTTIHWHGLRIPDDMDGVPMIQAPIEPGESFTYEFTLPDAGTFWYHPHVRSHEQIERGLQGMLVVHEAEPPAFDVERAFVIDDVLLQDSGRMSGFGLSGMNAVHGRHGNALLVNGSMDAIDDAVAPGTVERWRIVNTANARTMWINVENADWRVVAIDGTSLADPLSARRLQLPVGRRFDLEVVVSRDVAPVLNVELPAGGAQWDAYPMFTPTLTEMGESGTFLPWSAPALTPQAAVEQEVEVVFGVQGGPVWTINGSAFDPMETIEVDAGVPTRITVRDTTGAEHPFHLHGQFFEVLSRSDGVAWPGRLDTALISPGETVELYTTFDNPGTWMAHCHILEHAELGMMTTFTAE